jgi:hypothetical protein
VQIRPIRSKGRVMIDIITINGADPMALVQKPNGDWVTLCHPAVAEGFTPTDIMFVETTESIYAKEK